QSSPYPSVHQVDATATRPAGRALRGSLLSLPTPAAHRSARRGGPRQRCGCPRRGGRTCWGGGTFCERPGWSSTASKHPEGGSIQPACSADISWHRPLEWKERVQKKPTDCSPWALHDYAAAVSSSAAASSRCSAPRCASVRLTSASSRRRISSRGVSSNQF